MSIPLFPHLSEVTLSLGRTIKSMNRLVALTSNNRIVLIYLFVFNQIVFYLLSRITVAFAKLAVREGYISQPNFEVWPWFAAFVWGSVLWLFEFHRWTLQDSLRSSMVYLYDDSNIFNSLRNFLWHNK